MADENTNVVNCEDIFEGNQDFVIDEIGNRRVMTREEKDDLIAAIWNIVDRASPAMQDRILDAVQKAKEGVQ